ncbi:amidohydrolase family protein [Chloroflexota bacterium]
MRIGRFIVDTHVHSQRHAAGEKLEGSTEYSDLGRSIMEVEAYDNSPRLLYDMECYGVDMCIIEPAFGMSNELNVELVNKHPDKFVANCLAGTKKTRDKVAAGEMEWSIIAVLEELDELLKTGNYVGIGEGIPAGKAIKMKGGYPQYTDEVTLMREMFMITDLARSYKVPVRFHCGTNVGYEGAYHSHPWTFNPLWAHDLAVNFPDVTIIMEHGGIEGYWWEQLYEGCVHVAASHNNAYLETGRYWSDLYYKPLQDPNIGPEKMLWGTDWGASLPVQTNWGSHLPQTFTEQVRKDGIIRHQVDIWGWSLKQLARLDISQDDLNLILGGNAVRVYNLRTPGGLTRMFKFVD